MFIRMFKKLDEAIRKFWNRYSAYYGSLALILSILATIGVVGSNAYSEEVTTTFSNHSQEARVESVAGQQNFLQPTSILDSESSTRYFFGSPTLSSTLKRINDNSYGPDYFFARHRSHGKSDLDNKSKP